MQTLAFAGSNSSKSINHQLVSYVASFIPESKLIRLTDFNIPLYSIDIEEEQGIPEGVHELLSMITAADRIVLSVNEHNGNVSAFWKSTLDWMSRVNRKFLEGKQVLLLSTAPGGRGGVSARTLMEASLPHFGAELVGSFGLPRFHDNFKDGQLLDVELDSTLKALW